MDYFVGDKEYFKGIKKINYENPKRNNPLAFKFYDKDKIVVGKTIAKQLKFACAYWHSFCANETDPFGGATMSFSFAETAIAFIKGKEPEKDFKCNIEATHATLVEHTFDHGLQVCADKRMLGSVNANQGDNQNGWDTDEFPYNVYETTKAMLVILKNGGLGGLNFDAFVAMRYSSFDASNGKKFEDGKMNLSELAKLGQTAQTKLVSGKQE